MILGRRASKTRLRACRNNDRYYHETTVLNSTHQNEVDINSPESRKAVFRALVDLYAAGDVSSLDQVIPPEYVGHASTGDRDREGFRQSILYFHNLFIYTKDSFNIEDQLVDGEKVVTRMTAHVRSRETGEPITLLGINIAHIIDGKIVEEWNTWEQLKIPQS
jgi:predicted SnoaL-like aldol condensation-catalyzing enzyme